MRELGLTIRGEFGSAYIQFVLSGESRARYDCAACITIEKFGQAIQFKESFQVEFEITESKPESMTSSSAATIPA